MSGERLLQRAIMDRLAVEPGLLLFRNAIGQRRSSKGAHRYGLYSREHPTGSSDLIGLLGGVFFALEVKLPGEEANEAQRLFINAVNLNGGYARVVHSVDAAVAAVREARKLFKRRIVA